MDKSYIYFYSRRGTDCYYNYANLERLLTQKALFLPVNINLLVNVRTQVIYTNKYG